MKFRTEIDIPKSSCVIDYQSKILSLGSCFAMSIGGKLLESKFSITLNPVGVLFNPLSICATLRRFEECRLVEESELQAGRDGRWFHFDFHSSLSAIERSEAAERMNNAVKVGHDALSQSDTVIITLGTTWVYHLVQSESVVACCHKEPAKRFVRRGLSVDEVVESLSAVVESYPSKRFIFSVSPVRHVADGLAENSLSKATLRVAIDQVVQRYANVTYFPAYEILVDDLRDYRFYAEDMVHPSSQAVDYIWSKFRETHIAQSAYPTMERVSAIVRAASHRPFTPASEAYMAFCRKELDEIEKLSDLDFGKEYAFFMSQLQNNL